MKYFTSDLHIGDDRLGIFPDKPNVFFRPFKSVKEQNTTILTNLQKDIKAKDELTIIGDVLYSLEYIKELEQLPDCKLRTLIIGNYDEDKLKQLTKYFDYVLPYQVILEEGFDSMIFVNHYPVKCLDYMKKNKDCELSFTGHIHSLWKVQPNMINVSTDAWHLKPVSLDTLKFCWVACQKYYDKNVFPHTK